MKATTQACACAIFLTTSAFAQPAEGTIKLHGEVQPLRVTDVKSEVAGRIRKLCVGIGDQVKAGDLLAEIDETETLSKTEVRAPDTGTVLRLPVIEGQFVQPASGLSGGTTLTTIANLSKVIVEAHVRQDEAGKLALKQSLQVTAVSFPEERMEAAITFIAPIATVKGSVKGFTVQAVIDKPFPKLLPGASVQLTGPR